MVVVQCLGGSDLGGRRELRPVLGGLGRERDRQALATSAARALAGREALWWCPGLVWFGSSSLTFSLTVFHGINRLSGGPNEHIVLK